MALRFITRLSPFFYTVQIFEEFCKLGGKGAIIFSDGLELLEMFNADNLGISFN
ncbi:MAG: hypothetical protein KAW12_09535 [Candidatus Aminicenantes bacterium]|nr:hypothetical protein [Candidatus Aminicenantes bacterium]